MITARQKLVLTCAHLGGDRGAKLLDCHRKRCCRARLVGQACATAIFAIGATLFREEEGGRERGRLRTAAWRQAGMPTSDIQARGWPWLRQS